MYSTSALGRRLATVAAGLAGLTLGSAAMAQTVVVSSSGPSARSYPAGRSLAAGSRITLVAGDSLTVLDSRGTRTLRGPGSFGAEASSAAANRSFSALVDTQNRRRARTGAVRRPGEKAVPPSLWFVNITASGPFCVANPAAVQLWRPDMQQAATLTVSDSAGRSASVDYAVGQNTVAWPTAVPIAEGRTYTLKGAGLPMQTQLRFALVGAEAAAAPATAFAALNEKGCTDQKQLLVAALKPADAS